MRKTSFGATVAGLSASLLLLWAAGGNAQAPAAPAAAPAAPPKVVAPQSQEAKPTTEGKDIANFSLPAAFENKMLKFADIIGASSAKLTVLTFTNTSCAACMDEMGVLTALKSKLGKDLLVVAVVTDYNAGRIAENLGEDTKKAFAFLSDPHFTVPPLYGFTYTPATAFVKGGKVVSLESGYNPSPAARDALKAKVESLIK